ncbi:type IV pili methyl-accepting chemotaxis transducer N-terminal domain-containing protein [Hydrogenophaga sp.]|uniref:type IV pili methyl-accepting chemotaxis transducer N-terminal domain-containing protein n=1 Tax=Hydrogenophaga sp. TaxID=1904254 RepID=UPI003D291249
MVSTASLSTKLVRIGAGLLLVALASIGLTLWVTWQLEGGAAAVNEAGRMRMQTWRLTSVAQAGRAPQEVATLVQQFDQSLELLRHGDASRPLFVPWDDAVGREFATVEALWQNQRPLWLQDRPPEPTQALATADAFVEAIDALVLAIEKQLSGFTAILNLFQFLMMALAIGGAVVMLYTGYMYVIHPLAHLRQGLRRLESGDFKARVEAETLDEFGQVAAGFNRMAATLQSMYAGLETQVETKTRHIEAQRARLETLYEVSAFLARAGSIEELSRGFAQRVRAVVKADAVAVRWSDEASQRYLMLASDCFPQDMLEEERSLLAGAWRRATCRPMRWNTMGHQPRSGVDVRSCCCGVERRGLLGERAGAPAAADHWRDQSFLPIADQPECGRDRAAGRSGQSSGQRAGEPARLGAGA